MIHVTAVVDPAATIGEGTTVWAHAYILAGAVVGRSCRVGHAAFIDRGVRIGDRVVIHNKASLYRPVTVEDDVFIGPHVVLANDPDPRPETTRDLTGKSWCVRRGAVLGANVTVLSDVNIAEYTLAGAGAVITRSTTRFGIYVGVPARLVGYRCACGCRYETLPAVCARCHVRF